MLQLKVTENRTQTQKLNLSTNPAMNVGNVFKRWKKRGVEENRTTFLNVKEKKRSCNDD